MRTKPFVVVGVLVALLLAGVVSFYASSNPDGLEYVAEKTGFIDTADDHAAKDSPFADYGTAGVEDDRLSTGVAGVVGSVVVLLLAGGLAYAVRRRGRGDADPDKRPEDGPEDRPEDHPEDHPLEHADRD
ncbi:MAG TPA: PDGLE domain-containing protein [Nocardioidaceae bacterium]|nr:PDGLE domain-containing protein [Nocardioidaceae bacterium]